MSQRGRRPTRQRRPRARPAGEGAASRTPACGARTSAVTVVGAPPARQPASRLQTTQIAGGRRGRLGSLGGRAGAHHRRDRVRRATPLLLLRRARPRGPRPRAARAARRPCRRASSAHAADLRDAAVGGRRCSSAAAPDRGGPPGRRVVGRALVRRARLATWDVNLGGTLGAARGAARRTAPRRPALIVTSGEIHGRVPVEDLPVTADTPLRPLSPYGASKAAADLAAGQYRAGLRRCRRSACAPSTTSGPGQDARFVLPNVARQIARAERDGLRRRSRCTWATSTRGATSSTCATWCAPTGCCWSAATPTSSTWPAAGARCRCGDLIEGLARARAGSR